MSEAGTRRGLLGLLAMLPVLGGLFALLDSDEVDAKGRRKRRKKGHKHGKGRRRKHHKKCNAESKGKTCAGTCGSVVNNCKKPVDCGSCACDPTCEVCFLCQEGPNTPGACVVDPEQVGDPCGSATCSGGVFTAAPTCDGSGTCQPGSQASCAPYIQCAGNACATSCADDDDCVAGSFCDLDDHCVGDEPNGQPCDDGEQCQSGFCVDGVCCNESCAGACEACNLSGNVGACTTEAIGSSCGGGDICCGVVCQECCDAADCPACQSCDQGACVADATQDGDCCGTGQQCAAGECETVETAPLAACNGQCDCDSSCSGSPIRAFAEVCGAEVACPPCVGGCTANGCSTAFRTVNGPNGEGYYCFGNGTGQPCSGSQVCPAPNTFCGGPFLSCHPLCTGA